MEAPSGSRGVSLVGQWQVVGIMPPAFRFLDMTPQPDVIVAVRLDPAKETINSFSEQLLARLAPGVTAAAARADLERMLPTWLDAWPLATGSAQTKEAIASWRITPIVRPLKDDLVAGVASALWVFMGAIGAVLLIACANIANLMLVRADARRQEFAALGAVPARIARELFVESLVLGAAGSVLGLGLAYVGVQLLAAIGPSNLPRLEEIAVYTPVLAFTVAIALASTVVFGAFPALRHALHIDMPMSGSPRGASASRERSKTRSALVVVQVALALVLVVSAALMVRTFQALRNVDPGFSNPATIHTAGISIPFTLVSGPDQVTRVAKMTSLQHEILDRIAALPGVASAGFVSDLPMAGGSWIVIQVWRSVDAFRGESSVSTWMYRVALNTAIAWTRKQDTSAGQAAAGDRARPSRRVCGRGRPARGVAVSPDRAAEGRGPPGGPPDARRLRLQGHRRHRRHQRGQRRSRSTVSRRP